MSECSEFRERPVRVERAIVVLAVLCTVAMAVSLAWNVDHVWRCASEEARAAARGAYNKDVAYRRWAAGHGGVYVPVTERTPPNPYLAHVQERDIVTPSNRRLTLVNPAYMTRQVQELEVAEYGLLGHITSLRPIRPENAPDPWEREALGAFEEGETEVTGLEMMSGAMHMRLMRPLVTEERCLKCHGEQGYSVGDIRGGVSVSVRMAPYSALARAQTVHSLVGHGTAWLVGMLGLGAGYRRLRAWRNTRIQTEVTVFETNDRLQRQIDRRRVAEEDLRASNEFLRQKASELESAQVATLNIMQDVERARTTAERAYDELGRANTQLEKANAEMEQFVYTVSHDLKSPLLTIQGFVGHLTHDASGGRYDRLPEYCGRVEGAANRMERLIDELLNLSRVGLVAEAHESIRLVEVIRRIIAMHDERIAELGITVVIPEFMPPIRGDEERIIQVLDNLITNAIKHGCDVEDSRIEIGAEEGDNAVRVFVKDSGRGIAKEHQGKIFGLFQRLQADNDGTGVGLAIVKRIVEVHGGRIWVESSPGAGATFWVEFPGDSEAPVPAEAAALG